MKVWFNLKDSALISAHHKVISTIQEFANSVTLLARIALDSTLVNVHPVMKPDHILLRIALVLKNAQILSTLTRVNSFVTLAIALAKLVRDHSLLNV